MSGLPEVAVSQPIRTQLSAPFQPYPFTMPFLSLPPSRNHHRRHSSVDRDDVRRWEPLSPWCMLRASVSHFKKRLKPEALTAMAELFLLNGDLSALLYTGGCLGGGGRKGVARGN